MVEWTAKGCSVPQIARALGVSLGVITADRRKRARQLAGVKVHSGGLAKLPPDPPPFDWMAPPPPKVERAYKMSMFPRIQNLLVYLQENNSRARLPYNIEEAREAGDVRWHSQAQLLLIDLIAYLEDLLKILQDKSVRQEAAVSTAARDDLTRTVIPSEVSMPEPGVGAVPGRLFRVIWGHDWAGIPFTDQVIAQIAQRETTTPARVVRAIREFEQAKSQFPR